ncbi:MAG TPA: ABC transporter ATP-binding protein [Burkholderiales bacterium]|jgi:simple sugar transport system ATP-binding protein
MSPSLPLLTLRGIVKRYPGVTASDGVDLDVHAGEIHAVLGENGAGKSTLMKVIYGVTQPDAGHIAFEGESVVIPSPKAARALGIGMVFQHFSLFDSITVVENVAVALPGRVDLKALARRIAEVSERYGLDVNPSRAVHDLSMGERQRVEITRCLLQSPRLLIMDEPTSVLTPQAVDQLFVTLRQLRDEGTAILYISHKLDEILKLCQRATILRDGKVVAETRPDQETEASLAQKMIGRDFPECRKREHGEGAVVLEVAGLSLQSETPFGTALKEVSLRVHAGEILGIAGISGNGQSELLDALSGERTADDRNAIRLNGAAIGALGPLARRGLGLTYVPEDRLHAGAIASMSLTHNALLTAHRRGMVHTGVVNFRAAREYAARCIREFQVKTPGTEALARNLSGGNLQKFILGREIDQEPKVLILAQPTWGVDVAAAAAIRQAVIDLAARGVAVLVISEELSEIFEICDRIAVMAGGRLSGARPVAETNAGEIGLLMSGMFEGAASPAAAAAIT